MTWKVFITSHWNVMAAIDFTTIEVWIKGGLVTYYLLFVMKLAMRRKLGLAKKTASRPDDRRMLSRSVRSGTSSSTLVGCHFPGDAQRLAEN